MQIEDIKNAIKFEERDITNNLVSVSATVTISGHVEITRARVSAEALVQAREHLTELILRKLYDDRRDILRDAVLELMCCNPYDSESIGKARDNLYAAAQRQ